MLPKLHMNKSLILSCALCVLAVTVMLLTLTRVKMPIQEAFSPPPFDANACAGIPDVPEDVGWKEYDAGVFRVFTCGKIKPEGNSADVWLTNPKSNTVWMKLRILDTGGSVLGETGLIKPGQYIQKMYFDQVPKTGTPIVLKIMTYEPETYYSMGCISINTTIY